MYSKKCLFLFASVLGLSLLVTACSDPEDGADQPVSAPSEFGEMTVYKSPTCGCCSKWITHLEEHGFKASVIERTDIAAVKKEYGIPKHLVTCHTGIIGGYVIEGHVPASDIQRLLKERPNVVGLAVAGMPAGSPGMEVPNGYKAAYEVLSFDVSGKTEVFSRH